MFRSLKEKREQKRNKKQAEALQRKYEEIVRMTNERTEELHSRLAEAKNTVSDITKECDRILKENRHDNRTNDDLERQELKK